MSLFFQFFAGVPMNETDAFPLIPLGRWLFPIGIYLLIMSFWFGTDRQNRRFVLVRYGRIQRWWRHYFLGSLHNGVFAAVCLPALFWIIDLPALQRFDGNRKEISAIFVLWTVHAVTLSALFLLLESLNVKKAIPSVILLFEGFTFLGGFYFRRYARFLFGMWGMYVQSNLYEEMYGFSVRNVMIAQGMIIMACYLLGSHWLRKREAEGV